MIAARNSSPHQNWEKGTGFVARRWDLRYFGVFEILRGRFGVDLKDRCVCELCVSSAQEGDRRPVGEEGELAVEMCEGFGVRLKGWERDN